MFLMRGSGAGCGVLRRHEALGEPITGAALHRGAFGAGGLAHLLRIAVGVSQPGVGGDTCKERGCNYYKCLPLWRNTWTQELGSC